MNKITKVTSIVLSILILNLVISCDNEPISPKVNPTQTTSVNEKLEPILTGLIIVATAWVIAKYGEGKWRAASDTNPEGCYKWGVCKNPNVLLMPDGGEGNGDPISSDLGKDVPYDHAPTASYNLLSDGSIIFTIDSDEEGYNEFFYADEIDISYSYTIDNQIFLDQLQRCEPIEVGGIYKVHKDKKGQKYIFIV